MTTLYGKQAKDLLEYNLSDYEELADDQQIKINHVSCDAGTDLKQRLYVKRIDGAFLMHCHHCGISGYYRPKETYRRIQELGSVTTTDNTLTYKEEYETANDNYDSFTADSKLWLSSYEFGKSLVDAYYIKETDDGILLPIFDPDYNIVGTQLRRRVSKPKYLTRSVQPFSYLPEYGDTIVITEDLLSSYKLNSVGYPALCLLGTKLSKQAMALLVTAHTLDNVQRAVVWLDDDLAGHKGTVDLMRELNVILPTTAIFLDQPKEIPLSELKSMEI